MSKPEPNPEPNPEPEPEPTTWEQLVELRGAILTEALPRHPEVSEAYAKRRREVHDYQQQLVEMLRTGLAEHQGIWYRSNDFPYFTEPNVIHNVIWFSCDPEQFTMDRAAEWLAQNFDIPIENIVICCNDPSLKTVPEVHHYHAFSRNNG